MSIRDPAQSPLLVGESNPYGAHPFYALWPEPRGASGDRLRKILGLTDDEYLARFDRVNLLVGTGWSVPRARKAADQLCSVWPVGKPFVLLGRRVVEAFGFGKRPLPTWVPDSVRSREFVLLPHPSGRSRVWNDPAVVDGSRRLVSRLLAR